MITSLTYWSNAPVASDLREQMKHEADQISHDWWAEGISFFPDPDGLNRAYGDSQLFLLYEELEAEDDSAMAWRDASLIINQLESWSTSHGITWVLSCAGDTVGTVANGHRDSFLADFLAEIKEIAELVSPVTPERLSTISNEYASRHG
ncbi:hypothetical protein [Lysobacter capsici]|uniref:hypothetical protein n=1 Tax=Lysobacter capsici TaxID=435897 RepID=UPI00287B768A|nr:hypothetical protein [Lysobacter capsici]WND80381.1 hypothetical protein RJ610_24425 [Lysobacter capsici]WND85578.1 hypothetical protein RJ609_24445 [Lysobacter capsici]